MRNKIRINQTLFDTLLKHKRKKKEISYTILFISMFVCKKFFVSWKILYRMEIVYATGCLEYETVSGFELAL